MDDTCTIANNGVFLSWDREGTAIIPCRVGEEHTLAQPYDPQDANTRTSSEWLITMPYDVKPVVGSRIIATIAHLNSTVEGVIGETNSPQSWQIATRVYMTRQVTAVRGEQILFKRDTDNNGTFETHYGPYTVKVVFDRVDPIETPLRYTPSGRSSYRPARLIFEDQENVNVQAGDIFLYNGYFGEVVSVIPGQQLRTEAIAWIDFSGAR